MTVTRRTTTIVLAAAAAAALAVPSHAFAGPAPDGGPADTPASVYSPAIGGRTDQQFWGQPTWLNPLSGLNLDRSSIGG